MEVGSKYLVAFYRPDYNDDAVDLMIMMVKMTVMIMTMTPTTSTTTTTMMMVSIATMMMLLIPRFPIQCRWRQFSRAGRWHQLHNQAGHTTDDHHIQDPFDEQYQNCLPVLQDASEEASDRFKVHWKPKWSNCMLSTWKKWRFSTPNSSLTTKK